MCSSPNNGIEVQPIGWRVLNTPDWPRRVPRDNGERGDILGDDRARGDDGTLTDGNSRQHRHATGDPHVIFDHHRAADRPVGWRLRVVLERPDMRVCANIHIRADMQRVAPAIQDTVLVDRRTLADVDTGRVHEAHMHKDGGSGTTLGEESAEHVAAHPARRNMADPLIIHVCGG